VINNQAQAQALSVVVAWQFRFRKGRRLLRLHLINATDNTRPLKVMPAAKVGVATCEIPENAVRVLLTGYGVSPACTSLLNRFIYSIFVVLITTPRLVHPAAPPESNMARYRPVEQRRSTSRHWPPFPRSHANRP
jgi:hypothetical protein